MDTTNAKQMRDAHCMHCKRVIGGVQWILANSMHIYTWHKHVDIGLDEPESRQFLGWMVEYTMEPEGLTLQYLN